MQLIWGIVFELPKDQSLIEIGFFICSEEDHRITGR
jgi:hypothetical protein